MASQVNSGESAGPEPVPHAGEDEMLATLQQAEVTADTLARLARTPQALKSRKVMRALATHPRTPRHVSIPLLRRMFTFDLLQITLTPAVVADLKRVAEDQILLRTESLPAGEKISLARRASGRVAAELLRDADERVISAALDNGRLVEAGVVTALMRPDARANLFVLVSQHAKWSVRREAQMALLRSEHTPIERAKEFAMHFPADFLREVVPESRWEALMGGAGAAEEF